MTSLIVSLVSLEAVEETSPVAGAEDDSALLRGAWGVGALFSVWR